MELRIAQFPEIKVNLRPIARKGVESIIESRMVALMQFTAPQI